MKRLIKKHLNPSGSIDDDNISLYDLFGDVYNKTSQDVGPYRNPTKYQEAKQRVDDLDKLSDEYANYYYSLNDAYERANLIQDPLLRNLYLSELEKTFNTNKKLMINALHDYKNMTPIDEYPDTANTPIQVPATKWLQYKDIVDQSNLDIENGVDVAPYKDGESYQYALGVDEEHRRRNKFYYNPTTLSELHVTPKGAYRDNTVYDYKTMQPKGYGLTQELQMALSRKTEEDCNNIILNRWHNEFNKEN